MHYATNVYNSQRDKRDISFWKQMIFWRVVNIFQNRFFQRCYVTFAVFVINGTARTNFVCFSIWCVCFRLFWIIFGRCSFGADGFQGANFKKLCIRTFRALRNAKNAWRGTERWCVPRPAFVWHFKSGGDFAFLIGCMFYWTVIISLKGCYGDFLKWEQRILVVGDFCLFPVLEQYPL